MTVAVVGDSKALQWQTALDEIAQDHGLRMHNYTKSAYAFASGMPPIKEGHYASCAEWKDRVLDDIVEPAPDVLITTSRVNSALADLDDPGSHSTTAMEAGTVETCQ